SPFRSAAAIALGWFPAGKVKGAANAPLPLPNATLTVSSSWFVTARSFLPSPFRSASATPDGCSPTGTLGGPGSPTSPPQGPVPHIPSMQIAPTAHTTGLPPTHAPDWHVSVCVQASPSSHAAPSSSATCPGTPRAHTSVVHELPSSAGTSVSSGALVAC